MWPWLAQIGYHGYHRAGWYALDIADNDGVESAWEIITEFQQPEVGQRIGEEGITIREIEPTEFLMLSYRFPRTEWVRKARILATIRRVQLGIRTSAIAAG